MTTILQGKVFTEFDNIPAAITNPLRPHVIGPQAQLVRYAQTAEKTLGLLGTYAPAAPTTYAWPNLIAGASVDPTYTQVYVDGALLRYLNDLIGSADTVVPVNGYVDRIRSSTLAFAANGTLYPRAAVLDDRDVAIGDVAIVSGVNGGVTYSLTTYVAKIVGDVVSAVTGAAAALSTNLAAQTLSASILHVGGPLNCVTATVDGSLYEGRPTGNITETYTVTALTSSSSAKFNLATLSVKSASGLDDVASVSPAVSGIMPVGTRGLTMHFLLNHGTSCSLDATAALIPPEDIIAGMQWKITVHQAYTPPVATSSGVYTGTALKTYLIQVTKGGPWSASPQITCTTADGTDTSGPTAVTAANTAVAVGSLGVLIAFSGTGLCAGSKWTIQATAPGVGSMQTLVLGQPLPTQLQTASDLNLQLCIKKNLVLPQNRLDAPPATNWTQTGTGITLNAGATTYDASWTLLGVQQPLPLVGGTVYVQYRAWLPASSNCRIQAITCPRGTDPTALVAANLGPVHPDNPIAYGVWQALLNAGGAIVNFSTTFPPSGLAGWAAALECLRYRTGSYNLVPLSNDPAVQALVIAHVNQQSALNLGLYRACFLQFATPATAPIVAVGHGTTDGNPVLATVSANPSQAGAPLNYFTITSGNATLITATTPIRAGDIVYYQFGADAFGNPTSVAYTVATVVNETTFTTTTATSVAFPVASKVEIWRVYTPSEIAAQQSAAAAAQNNTRVVYVWPDTFTDQNGLTAVPGYYACAGLAGLRGGVAPHRPLRGVQLAGIADVPRTNTFLNASNVFSLGTGGIWVIDTDTDGTVFNRYAVTSASAATVNTREEAVRNDQDACQLYLFSVLQPFFTTNNVHPGSLDRVRAQIQSAIDSLKVTGFSDELGALLTDATISRLTPSILNSDQVVLVLSPVQLPFPYSQQMSLTLTLSA